MASITDQTRWRRVLNHVAADLKAVIDIAAGQSVAVTQGTAANLLAKVTLESYRGILPNPATATRVMARGRISNGTNDFYTVDGGEVLFISSAWITVASKDTDLNYVEALYWRDGDDLNPEYLFDIIIHENSSFTLSNSYFPAKEVPAGFDICCKSGKAEIYVTAGISGWVETA